VNDSRRFQSFFQFGLAAATGGLLIGLVSMQLIARSHERHLLTELADCHMRSLVANHLVDVSSSQSPVVIQWLSANVNFKPSVPNLLTSGYTLMGGRADYVAGHPAAALVYTFNGKTINVFVWPVNAAASRIPETPSQERGYEIVGWTTEGLAYRAVATLTERDLRDFATAYQANAPLR
jgi:anti-sigma factor RsiW